jgi:pilus assembly protein Flp/PilA
MWLESTETYSGLGISGAVELPPPRFDLTMIQLLKKFVADESGQDMIEYALIAALLGLSVATVLRNFSNDIKGDFTGIGNSLTNAVL